MRPIVVVALLAVAIGLSGCRERASADTTLGAVDLRPAWGILPEVNVLRIAQSPARLQSRASTTLLAPQSGRLHLRVMGETVLLSAGEIWAEYDTTALLEEAARIEETRQRLIRVAERKRAIDVPRERLRLLQALEELQRQQALVRLVEAQRPKWRELGLPLPEANFSGPTQLPPLADEIRLSREAIAWLEREPEIAMGWNEGALLLELEGRAATCKRERERAVLRMPFSGRLRLEPILLGSGHSRTVQINEPLAMAMQDDRMEIVVVPTSVTWLTLPADRLRAAVRLPAGGQLSAKFSGTRERRLFGRDELESEFTLSEGDSLQARPLLGAETVCDLWLDLPQRARLVPKLTVALAAPAVCRERGWAAAVEFLWSGAKLLAEGESDLAMIRPNDKRP